MDSAISAASAPSLGYAATLAGVLLSPSATMRRLADAAHHGEGDMGGAILTVGLAFIFDALRESSAKELGWALLNVPLGLFAGIIMWLALAGTLALLASCFNAPRHQVKAIFVTSGWSFAPWLLMAPVFCYQGLAGGNFVLLATIPFIWTFIAQIFAIKETFELKGWQTFTLIFLVPVAYGMLSLLQLAQTVYVAFSAMGS